jgi:hypothetical protein
MITRNNALPVLRSANSPVVNALSPASAILLFFATTWRYSLIYQLLCSSHFSPLHTSLLQHFSPPTPGKGKAKKKKGHANILQTQNSNITRQHHTLSTTPSRQANLLIPSPPKFGNPGPVGGAGGAQTSLNVLSIPELKSPHSFSPAPCALASIFFVKVSASFILESEAVVEEVGWETVVGAAEEGLVVSVERKKTLLVIALSIRRRVRKDSKDKN